MRRRSVSPAMRRARRRFLLIGAPAFVIALVAGGVALVRSFGTWGTLDPPTLLAAAIEVASAAWFFAAGWPVMRLVEEERRTKTEASAPCPE